VITLGEQWLIQSAAFDSRPADTGETRQLAELGNAVELLSGLNPRRLRTAFGYADWWKLHALVYMLRHPREAYRTRDVRTHLAALACGSAHSISAAFASGTASDAT
jgi:hypothetical protein